MIADLDWATLVGFVGMACIIGAYAYLTLQRQPEPLRPARYQPGRSGAADRLADWSHEPALAGARRLLGGDRALRARQGARRRGGNAHDHRRRRPHRLGQGHHRQGARRAFRPAASRHRAALPRGRAAGAARSGGDPDNLGDALAATAFPDSAAGRSRTAQRGDRRPCQPRLGPSGGPPGALRTPAHLRHCSRAARCSTGATSAR